MNLLHLLQDKMRAALTGLVPDVEPYALMVKPTQDAKHGDYQANCAMGLAKALGKKPRDVAQEIVQRLPLGDELLPPEIAGPGFINFRLKDDWLAAQLQAMAKSDRLGVGLAQPPQTFAIDFSSPNVAKPLHVGHLRSTIIGDALTRLLRFLGHTVITDNHLGDWGTQFGILLYGYKNFLDKESWQRDPVRELLRLYLEVRQQMKAAAEDEEDEGAAGNPVAEAARQETAKLHAGDAENLKLWQQFMPFCRKEIDDIYQRLGVSFDHFHGESFYQPMLAGVVRDLTAKGIAVESQGAMAIFFGENKPPALVRKKDGAFTYTTSDLATIQYRVDTWHPDVILYLVGFPQSLHFENLFAAARRWGYDKVKLVHVKFGSVLGADGKIQSTRRGGGTELMDLLNEAVRRASKVYEQGRQEAEAHGDEAPELMQEEQRNVHEAVGIGAVKYADLCQNRTSDYKFDFDKMLAMTGNTATYMQYAYARNRSIFRKGGEDVTPYRTDPPRPLLETPHERALALALLRFEEALENAAAEYQPSDITSYLWDLAKTYSGFFQNCPVLKAPTPELKRSRLLLCDLTARVIQRGLELLGIRTMERM
jgi:arginyl-tRNA synthetase